MKIALLHPDSPTSEGTGAVHSATLIGESLQQQGHDVTFFCPGSVDDDYNSTAVYELEVDKESSSRNTYKLINDAILKNAETIASYDIFHSYLMRTIPSVGKISKNYGDLTTIITLNAYGAICPKNDLLWKNKNKCSSNGFGKCINCVLSSKQQLPPKSNRGRVYQIGRVIHHTIKDLKNFPIINNIESHMDHIDKYQALSSHVKSEYTNFGFPEEKIGVVPNILDEHFRVPHTSDLSPPFDLLYVGGLKYHKGADQLPRILDDLNTASKYDHQLSIVGEGPLKQDIQKELKQRGQKDNSAIDGFVKYNDLPKWYSSHDIFVYPGRWEEPFGRVFIEALAAGTPVVSTDVGSVSEITNSAGLVTKSAGEISKIIKQISSDQIQELSTSAMLECERFNRDNVVDDIEQLYQSTK